MKLAVLLSFFPPTPLWTLVDIGHRRWYESGNPNRGYRPAKVFLKCRLLNVREKANVKVLPRMYGLTAGYLLIIMT